MRGVHRAVDLRHLRAFAAIVDAGGFARAATRLNLSQPALSRQISALEIDLGVPLFDRVGRRALLTSEGEDLLRRSRRLLSDAESLGERARALKGGHTGLLRVGATPQAMETLLAAFLARYRRRHPGVEVHLVEDGGVRLPARLEHGDVHLALIAAGDARFRWRVVGPVYLLAVLPKSHRWARRATLEIEELADSPLLLTRRDFGSRAWFEAACQMAHVRPHVLLESGAPPTLVALAQAGYGIAIVPSNSRIPRGGLCAVPILRLGDPIGRWLGISWDPRRFLAPYGEQFVDELSAYARRANAQPRSTRRLPLLPRPREAPSGETG
jgi:LysR family transcriptional regulator, cyn operon transcriptional activator